MKKEYDAIVVGASRPDCCSISLPS